MPPIELTNSPSFFCSFFVYCPVLTSSPFALSTFSSHPLLLQSDSNWAETIVALIKFPSHSFSKFWASIWDRKYNYFLNMRGKSSMRNAKEFRKENKLSDDSEALIKIIFTDAWTVLGCAKRRIMPRVNCSYKEGKVCKWFPRKKTHNENVKAQK